MLIETVPDMFVYSALNDKPCSDMPITSNETENSLTVDAVLLDKSGNKLTIIIF